MLNNIGLVGLLLMLLLTLGYYYAAFKSSWKGKLFFKKSAQRQVTWGANWVFLDNTFFLVLSCTAPRALASLACHVVYWICYRRFSLACVPLFIQQVLRKETNQRRFCCNNYWRKYGCDRNISRLWSSDAFCWLDVFVCLGITDVYQEISHFSGTPKI